MDEAKSYCGFSGLLCAQGGGPLKGDRGMVVEKGCRRIIVILPPSVTGQGGICSSLKCSVSRGQKLISSFAAVTFGSQARGPPISI